LGGGKFQVYLVLDYRQFGPTKFRHMKFCTVSGFEVSERHYVLLIEKLTDLSRVMFIYG
jgi:hypothetical protein